MSAALRRGEDPAAGATSGGASRRRADPGHTDGGSVTIGCEDVCKEP